MNRKKWVVRACDKQRAAYLAENCFLEPLTAFLMCARGLTDETEIEQFLYDTDLSDAFLLPDMEAACTAVSEAMEKNEKITVFGDYDADGVTATALLYSYLVSKGANADTYIPDRAVEGYGMSCEAVELLHQRGTKLIITVDNGISALREVQYAGELGMQVVVTDHHRVGDTLPAAQAVVDPHRADNEADFCAWAGVGVAFKLISALEGTDGTALLEKYGDLVTLGTVADIVPLTGENRILVREGLRRMNESFVSGTLRPGLSALLQKAFPEARELDAVSAAFRLAPRINAAGRMGSAERALKLLLCEDASQAELLAQEICEANTLRQTTEAEITRAAFAEIETQPAYSRDRVLVVSGENWHQGVIGIVASRLTEKYGKPAVVLSISGEEARGSGRSIEGFSLYNALSACSAVLSQFGGHTLAAGMSLKTENIPAFRKAMNDYAATVPACVPVLCVDCKLNPASLNTEMLPGIRLLEPFGAENPSPVFGLYKMTLGSINAVGNGKHLRLSLSRGGAGIQAMLFSVGADEFGFRAGDTVDLAVKLSENEYMGAKRLSIQIKAIRPSWHDDDAVTESLLSYEQFLRTAQMDANLVSVKPDREFLGKIFRFLKAGGGWAFDAELLAFRLGLSEEHTAACQLALDVFLELGLLTKTEKGFCLSETQEKVDLENSALYRRFMTSLANAQKGGD